MCPWGGGFALRSVGALLVVSQDTGFIYRKVSLARLNATGAVSRT